MQQKSLIALYQTYSTIMVKVYNFDTKRLPLCSNRLLPNSNRLQASLNRLPLFFYYFFTL